MKKLSYIAFCITIIALSVTSCRSKGKTESTEKSSIELKPASEEVSGQLEGCFTVMEKTYKVKFEDFSGGILTVELKRTDDPLPFESEGRVIYNMSSYSASPYVQVGFGIEILDADGNVIDKTSASGSGLSGSYSPDEAVELVKLKEGKTGTIRFRIDDDAKEAVSFRITSAYNYGGSDAEGISVVEVDDSEEPMTASLIDDDETVGYNDDDIKTSSSGKSENWDTILDSYERFANKYVEFYKKVKNGTITITSPEYAEYMQESLEFTEKLSQAQSDMTTAQIMRMNKIAAKIAAAIN